MISDLAFKKNLNDTHYVRYYDSKSFKPWMLRIGYSPPHLTAFYTKSAIKKICFITQFLKLIKLPGHFPIFLFSNL